MIILWIKKAYCRFIKVAGIGCHLQLNIQERLTFLFYEHRSMSVCELCSTTGAPGSPMPPPPCGSLLQMKKVWQMWIWSSTASLIVAAPAGTWGPSGPSANSKRTRYAKHKTTRTGKLLFFSGPSDPSSLFSSLQLYLGMYPDEHFIEKPVKQAMEKFRKQLTEISSFIKKRNDGKKLPYAYLSPDKIPNSVAVWGPKLISLLLSILKKQKSEK